MVNNIKHDLTMKPTQATVIPDGWIDFRFNEKAQVCIRLEIDMDNGSEILQKENILPH
jgi:hypothetical protein